MLRIMTACKPSLQNIDVKYHDFLYKIKAWSESICAMLKGEFYGIYVRGSMALGCATENSDLDVAILVTNCWQNDVLNIKLALRALIAVHKCSRLIDIKVFNVKEAYVDVAEESSEDINKKLFKYINFDLSANGVSFCGSPLNDALALYDSELEFREINQLMWGEKIKTMVEEMNHTSCCQYLHFYPLIKRCIRLAAYVKFTKNSPYYGTTQDCFNFALEENKIIKQQLKFIYNYYNQRALEWERSDIVLLAKSIRETVNYLLDQRVINF